MSDDADTPDIAPAAKRAIHHYLLTRMTAVVVGFGVANVVALATVVPRWVANQVVESTSIRAERDRALESTGELRESQRRAQEVMKEASQSLTQLSAQLESARNSDPAKTQRQIEALNKLEPAEGKSILGAIQRLDGARGASDKALADVLYEIVSIVCSQHPAECANNAKIGAAGAAAHSALVQVVNKSAYQ